MTELNPNDDFVKDMTPGKFALGLKGGLIIGIIYITLLFIKYSFFSNAFVPYTTFGIISYLFIIALYLVLGIFRRRELGKYSETKDIFICLLIAIVMTEGCYILFNFIYLKYINPDFGTHYLSVIHDYFTQKGVDAGTTQERMSAVKLQYDDIKKSWNMNLFSWATWIIIDGVIGLMISMFLRRPKPQFN